MIRVFNILGSSEQPNAQHPSFGKFVAKFGYPKHQARNQIAMDQSNQTDWITIAQAAKEFARTRQAIESLVKKGCIGHKRMGNKANIHISRGELQLHYANLATPKLATKSSPVEGAKFANQTHSMTLQIQLIQAQAEAKRLADLLELHRESLVRERIEKDRLVTEISALTAEVKALLTRDSPTGALSRWVKSKIA
jgi:hypothetical protein